MISNDSDSSAVNCSSEVSSGNRSMLRLTAWDQNPGLNAIRVPRDRHRAAHVSAAHNRRSTQLCVRLYPFIGADFPPSHPSVLHIHTPESSLLPLISTASAFKVANCRYASNAGEESLSCGQLRRNVSPFQHPALFSLSPRRNHIMRILLILAQPPIQLERHFLSAAGPPAHRGDAVPRSAKRIFSRSETGSSSTSERRKRLLLVVISSASRTPE